jgi:glyoxylase-like metal-dependent hydrolase (beta-lactamase superfamily II)
MLIETFTVGTLSTNCYVAHSQQTKEAIIIDPGIELPTEAQQIFDYITEGTLKVKYIINTHGHQDHITGDTTFQAKYHVPICIHKLDALALEDLEKDAYPEPVLLQDGDTVSFGDESLKVLHTPGHSPGSICLIGEHIAFTGDTLFAGGIGRTDFAGGSDVQMQQSLQKLMHLPDYLLIYPGHGPTSMMGEEKRVNPFLTYEGF